VVLGCYVARCSPGCGDGLIANRPRRVTNFYSCTAPCDVALFPELVHGDAHPRTDTIPANCASVSDSSSGYSVPARTRQRSVKRVRASRLSPGYANLSNSPQAGLSALLKSAKSVA
jgi:hypothetical protein